MKLQTLVTVGFLVALYGANPAAAGQNLVRDFKELTATATSLESAEMLLSNRPEVEERLVQQRRNSLYVFARAPKSAHCQRHFESVNKVINEFKIKGYNFVTDLKKGKHWFVNFIQLGGPMGAMKNLAKFDPELQSVANRYEKQARDGKLSNDDIDCDVVKFQIRNLQAIMFILQTDIKYLLIEDQQILNRAIYEQLKADKFVSNTNFFEPHPLTGSQRDRLLEFFAGRVNLAEINVEQAVDHFYNPGEFILGRLLDSCRAALKYQDEWNKLDIKYNDFCSRSTSDPREQYFPGQFNSQKYGYIYTFCDRFFKAL